MSDLDGLPWMHAAGNQSGRAVPCSCPLSGPSNLLAVAAVAPVCRGGGGGGGGVRISILCESNSMPRNGIIAEGPSHLSFSNGVPVL